MSLSINWYFLIVYSMLLTLRFCLWFLNSSNLRSCICVDFFINLNNENSSWKLICWGLFNILSSLCNFFIVHWGFYLEKKSCEIMQEILTLFSVLKEWCENGFCCVHIKGCLSSGLVWKCAQVSFPKWKGFSNLVTLGSAWWGCPPCPSSNSGLSLPSIVSSLEEFSNYPALKLQFLA